MNKGREEDQIDLIALSKQLWDERKFISKVFLFGIIIGIIIAFSIPKEYTSTVILTTESQKSLNGSMGMLASMTGISLGSAMESEMLSPELYPEVLNSTPFIQDLLDINVYDLEQEINSSLYNYIKDEQKYPWWDYILKLPGTIFPSSEDSILESNTNNSRSISKENMRILNHIKDSYSITTDKKTGVTTIEVTMQSPQIAAYIADTIASCLQKYIIEKRTQKAKTDLKNTEKLYEKAKTEYYIAQQNLALFTDRNQNVVSARFKTSQEKLQNEATLAYNVYNQMAQQVQMNKIKVQDETPVFTIIQPAIEPLYPEKPKKKIIIFSCVFLSILVSSIWILGKKRYFMYINKKNIKC